MNKEKNNSLYIEGNIMSCIDIVEKLNFVLNFDGFKDVDCVINGKTITLDKRKLEEFLLQFVKESEE